MNTHLSIKTPTKRNVCSQAAARAFSSSERDSTANQLLCFMILPSWWRWMTLSVLTSLLFHPPPLSLAPLIPVLFFQQPPPRVSASCCLPTHEPVTHPLTHLTSPLPPHYLSTFTKTLPLPSPAHLRASASRLISDGANVAGREVKGCRWKCQTNPGGTRRCLCALFCNIVSIPPLISTPSAPFTLKAFTTFSLSASCCLCTSLHFLILTSTFNYCLLGVGSVYRTGRYPNQDRNSKKGGKRNWEDRI